MVLLLRIVGIARKEGKSMLERVKRIGVAVSASAMGILMPVMAFAQPPSEFTLPDLPMGQIYTLGGTILAGLAVMWVLRKIVKTTNRS